jgi:hypothetical protein
MPSNPPNNPIKVHLDLLGRRVADKVTGFEGVVTSISFDLYGCIQAIVNPGLDKDRKPLDQHWFDVNRLAVLTAPVMDVPNYGEQLIARGDKGAAEKPKGRSI